MSKKKEKEEQRINAIEQLKNYLFEKTSVYTTIKKVSSSGMSRQISVLCVRDGEIMNISSKVSDIFGYKWNDNGSITVSGCGMDMGFHVVYELGQVLYGNGYSFNHRHV